MAGFMTRLFAGTALATIMLSAAAPMAAAQVLSGKVTDTTGTAPLQGAIVSIEGLNRTASTDRFGEYRIANLPAGEYTVVVSYGGAPDVSSSVTVAPSGAELDFTLGADVRYLDNILVVGQKAAQASAINQHRAAHSNISLVDSDGLNYFPDTTLAPSLQRVPGLSILPDHGEGRPVERVRGVRVVHQAPLRPAQRVGHDQQFHQVVVDGVAGRLNQVDVAAPNRLLNLNV